MHSHVHEEAVHLEAILPRMLRTLFRHEATDPLGHLTVSQLRMMRTLSAQDRSAVELSADLKMTQSAVSQTLQRLEAMGLIERRPDAHDGRVRSVGLSEIGAKLVLERQSLRVSRAEAVLQRMPERHRRELVESLTRLAELCEPSQEPLSLVAELEQALPLATPTPQQVEPSRQKKR